MAIRYSVETELAPEAVMAAATDFSERRPDLWPNIDRNVYRVHATGESSADVTEGSKVLGGIWARERYEWTGDTITAHLQESNVFASGTWRLHVSRPAGGRTLVEVVNDRARKRNWRGRILGLMLRMAGTKPFVKALNRTLAIVAAAEGATASGK